MEPERIPPQNRDAERAVLGGVLRWSQALWDVAQMLRPEDFYGDPHQRVFAAMLALYAANKPVDIVTVNDEIRQAGHTKDAPPSLLASLWDDGGSGGNAAYHAKLVKDASVLRGLLRVAEQIRRDAQDGAGSAEQQLEAAERAIFHLAESGQVGEAVALKTVIYAAAERIEQASLGRVPETGLATGFIDLDRMTGGFQPGQLVVVGARPGGGKSALGLDILRRCMLRGVGGLLVSLEMNRQELAERLLAAQTGIEAKRLRRGRLNSGDEGGEWVLLSEAAAALSKPAVFVDDAAAQRVVRIASNARKLKMRHNIGLIVVDYIQLIEPEDRRVQRYEQIGNITRRLKILAGELQVPLLVMSQVGRGAEERSNQRPRLSDLRESGNIEADADTVLLLHRDENVQGVIEVNVAKQRNGPTGPLTLAWHPEILRFDNYAFGEICGDAAPSVLAGY